MPQKTAKIFWQDPYLCELDTHVTAVSGDDVTVAETIFYAESGGQESDSGIIGPAHVLDARWRGGDIVYALAEDHGLQPGDAVTMKIDWPRRYRLMRLHFAAELVLELAYTNLPEIKKIGAHIAEDKARIDFSWPRNISESFTELTSAAQAVIDDDRPIISAFSDAAAERRYWEVEGFARVPCGGTHLRHTGEVGSVALRRRNIGKNKERIEITAAPD